MTPSRRHVTVGLGAISLATFVAVTSEFLPIGVLPLLASGLDVSTSIAGLSVSVFAVIVAVLAVPMTALTERVPRKALLVAALAGYALSNTIVALAPDFGVLCVGRAVGGLSHAVFYSVVTAYAGALVPPQRVGRTLSIAFAGATLGIVLGVPLTTLIGTQAGWRAAFAVAAGAAVVLAVGVLAAVPGVPDAVHEDARYRPGRGLVGVVIADAFVFIGHFTAYTYVAPLLERAGIVDTALSGALFVLGVVAFGGVILAGVLGDRHLRVAFAGSAAVIAVTLALLGPLGTAAAPTLVVTAVWSVAFGAISPLVATAAVRTGAVSDSMAGAVVNATGNAGITIGSLVGAGVIALDALPVLPLVGALIAAVGVVLTITARRAFARRSDPIG